MFRSAILTISFVAFFAAAFSLGYSSSKIHPNLLQTLKSNPTPNIFLTIDNGNPEIIARFEANQTVQGLNRAERLDALAATLKDRAFQTQKNVQDFLEAHEPSILYKSFWLTNHIYIEGADLDLINELAPMTEITEIFEEEIGRIEDPVESIEEDISPLGDAAHQNATLEWGIKMIQADLAWTFPQLGNRGQNVTVANIDTGVRRTHESLNNTFVGEFGWYDPYFGSLVPNDGNGHGTHVMGTIAGSHGIGVAPGVKWMACRGCTPQGTCAVSQLLACGQFMTCPNNGTHTNCSMAPHVIANSWSLGQNLTFYQWIVGAWRAAGIVPVFSIGNVGPGCKSNRSPGEYEQVLGIGATDSKDAIAYFSSRGPSNFGNKTKPDISAPGAFVRSASHTGDSSYSTKSGTSMAVPHVAGLVALIKSADPTLTFNGITKHIFRGADPHTLKEVPNYCGSQPGKFPNNVYGHGRINALRSLQSLKASQSIDH